MFETKSQILDRLNKTNQFVVMEPAGPVVSKEAKMPILLVLRAIAEAQGLKPGENCEITDFVVTADSVTLEYLDGEFSKENVVPDQVGELFSGGRGTNRFED